MLERFVADGASVAATAHRHPERLQQRLEAMPAEARARVRSLELDVTSLASV